uniref:Uncharacterized protein n=1 Tax=Tanacetum cinerariifolium TaxID=118510 RepID=A0A6L2MSX5_TANCI|nr:hypothetical protein [Tanacetum cinerariifolium]
MLYAGTLIVTGLFVPGLRRKYRLCLENVMPLRNKIIIALINKPVFYQIIQEKAHRRGQEYNWETATYGKIWYDKDVHCLKSYEKEFPAIVYNDALTSEPEVSFDFENEYLAIVYNNTLTSEPKVLIDFENEFPAIVYNDALISEPKILAEPTKKKGMAQQVILGVSYSKSESKQRVTWELTNQCS